MSTFVGHAMPLADNLCECIDLPGVQSFLWATVSDRRSWRLTTHDGSRLARTAGLSRFVGGNDDSIRSGGTIRDGP